MPPSQRAKQFGLFDALKGLKELAQDAVEELNRTICALELGTMVTVVYYCRYQEEYCQITGAVEKVDAFWSFLQIGKVCVDFDDIAEIPLLR